MQAVGAKKQKKWDLYLEKERHERLEQRQWRQQSFETFYSISSLLLLWYGNFYKCGHVYVRIYNRVYQYVLAKYNSPTTCVSFKSKVILLLLEVNFLAFYFIKGVIEKYCFTQLLIYFS